MLSGSCFFIKCHYSSYKNKFIHKNQRRLHSLCQLSLDQYKQHAIIDTRLANGDSNLKIYSFTRTSNDYTFNSAHLQSR